ncbi:MmgE/PrpD family protein [Nostoc sp. TCL26-01]|uniref:MmgE/PrpD family protein n=1 Tax=Nostoc sp. TCL26-01 TaxID=2576904 RepID=UPI0015BBA2B4|nr:MmgE/PrpD family protein [Nostoc sp. TCL26-01]QLE59658.1 MmgE/PrpD family protein [Nostoc sp. TCL26-01]
MIQENTESNNSKQSKFSIWGKELEPLAQEGVKKEISKHKVAGCPIFYSLKGVAIIELSDGRCFEYHLRKNGTREIIREVKSR